MLILTFLPQVAPCVAAQHTPREVYSLAPIDSHHDKTHSWCSRMCSTAGECTDTLPQPPHLQAIFKLKAGFAWKNNYTIFMIVTDI